jgi:hypothetical protein
MSQVFCVGDTVKICLCVKRDKGRLEQVLLIVFVGGWVKRENRE